MRKFLPTWFSKLTSDADDSDELSFVLPWLFQNCLPVAGVLHIFANGSKDLHGALSSWTSFYCKLKRVERLVCVPKRLQRFVAQCVSTSLFASKAVLLARALPRLYDKRWLEVTIFVKRLVKIWPTLCACWNAAAYSNGADDESSEDDGEDADASGGADGGNGGATITPDSITALVKDEVFSALLTVVLLLGDVLQEMTRWSERCPCHEKVQAQHDGHFPIDVLRRECGAYAETMDGLSCPCRSCRSADLAAGVHWDLLGFFFTTRCKS